MTIDPPISYCQKYESCSILLLVVVPVYLYRPVKLSLNSQLKLFQLIGVFLLLKVL